MHKPHETWAPSLVLRLVLGQRATIILDTQKQFRIACKHEDSILLIQI